MEHSPKANLITIPPANTAHYELNLQLTKVLSKQIDLILPLFCPLPQSLSPPGLAAAVWLPASRWCPSPGHPLAQVHRHGDSSHAAVLRPDCDRLHRLQHNRVSCWGETVGQSNANRSKLCCAHQEFIENIFTDVSGPQHATYMSDLSAYLLKQLKWLVYLGI